MKYLLIVLSLIVSTPAQSGIRVVGNPSGYIENQLIYTWGQMINAIEKCLTYRCATDVMETDYLKSILATLNPQSTKIEFHSEAELANIKGKLFSIKPAKDQTKIIFNVEELYRRYPDPIQFSLLTSLEVLFQAFELQHSDQPNSGFKALANALYQLNFHQEQNIDLGNYGLPTLFLKISGAQSSMLFVSDETGLKELTPILNGNLRCSDTEIAQVMKIHWVTVSGFDSSEKLLALDTLIEFKCSNNRYLANVFIALPIATDLKLGQVADIGSIKLIIRNQVKQ